MDRLTTCVSPLFFSLLALASGPLVHAQTDSSRGGGPTKGGDGGAPTWADGVGELVHENCSSCHRPDQVAPFSLLTYADARRRGRMMVRVTESGYMPPWHPENGHGEFVDEARMKPEQIAMLREWVAAGMPEGDPAAAPKPPEFRDGWMLGEPDLVVEMADGFTVPADGPDIYRNFVVPLDLDEDKWLTAIEVRPSARGVLHHIIFRLDTKGEARARDGQDGQPGFSGMGGGGLGLRRGDAEAGDANASTSGLGGWAVGGMPRHLPMGLARRIPQGADLVLNSHLHPSGKVETERTTLGLYFAKKPPKRSMVGLQLPPAFGIAAGLDIPAGQADFVVRDTFTLPVAVQAVDVGGHAHQVCASMQVWVKRPRQERESIFYVAKWDFDWQNRYQYREPVNLPAGTEVEVEIHYDNSINNPNNPHRPPQRVRWGPQSSDEMGSVTLLLVPKRERDVKELAKALDDHRREHFRGEGARTGIAAAMVSQLWMSDKDGDNRLSKDEVPGRLGRMFSRIDKDGDGFLSRDEVDAIADMMGGGRRR